MLTFLSLTDNVAGSPKAEPPAALRAGLPNVNKNLIFFFRRFGFENF